SGIAALHVPGTGITDYSAVAKKYADLVVYAGGKILTECAVESIKKKAGDIIVETTRGSIETNFAVNCAGLHSDRVMRLAGDARGLKIVPFRGEYYEIVPERRKLVRNLIYPVADPRFPFLGVHFTRMIAGGIEAGPNAVLALKREGYRKTDVSIRDVGSMLTFPGFWHMAGRYYQTGFGELWRSFSKGAFVRALQRLVPELKPADVRRGGSGVRAQAVDAKGNLLDDFRIVHAPRMVHVLNAPSPGATSSLSIGKAIADMALRHFD